MAGQKGLEHGVYGMKWERARSEEQKAERIAEIVAATERLYKKHSFEEITFVAIAEEADFTRSNLYKYFRSKEEIFLEFAKHDIILWRKSLERAFKKEKTYKTDRFVTIWVDTLVKHKRLLGLISILFADLEKNASFDSFVDFKFATKDEIERVTELLCRIFPKLTPDDASRFIYLQISAAVGLYQMTDYSEIQLRAFEHPELKQFKVDFKPLFKEAVEYLIKGLLE